MPWGGDVSQPLPILRNGPGHGWGCLRGREWSPCGQTWAWRKCPVKYRRQGSVMFLS